MIWRERRAADHRQRLPGYPPAQEVWTSDAHDADVLMTVVHTDPNALKHKRISVLMLPTDLPGVVRNPLVSMCDVDDLDFNEVFFNDVWAPAGDLIGPLR